MCTSILTSKLGLQQAKLEDTWLTALLSHRRCALPKDRIAERPAVQRGIRVCARD